jgi:hypothetical protein
MVGPGRIVGQAGRGLDWDRLWATVLVTLALVAVILCGALIIWLLDRWRRRAPQPGPNAGDQLTQFRKLYERGDLSAEEFARIRSLLTDRMMKEIAAPPPPAETPGSEPRPRPNEPTPGV